MSAPKLRAEVARISHPAGATLLCASTGEVVDLSLEEWRFVKQFDGVCNLTEMQHELSEAAVIETLECLAAARMLDDAASQQALAREEELRRAGTTQFTMNPLGEGREVFAQPELRFSCHGCTACCLDCYELSLNELDLQRLDRLPKALQALQPFVEAHPGRSRAVLLRKSAGRCIFLMADGRCRIHAHDYHMKPRACRAFPFALLQTPDGLLLRKRPECSMQHLEHEAAPLVDLQALCDELLEGQSLLATLPERLIVEEDRSISWSEYRELLSDLGQGLNEAMLTLRQRLNLNEQRSSQEQLHRQVHSCFEILNGAELLLDWSSLVHVFGQGVVLEKTVFIEGMREAFSKYRELGPDLERQLRTRLEELLWGGYLFETPNLASGLSLLELLFFLTRLSFGILQQPQRDHSSLLNACYIMWHRLLFSQAEARALILTAR